ncbi:HlyD family type I secretion periplasmic adaptor subunit [Cognatazoarcus halotolerans]|uniref:HlyD family type I secretion periplasmic adaptor subunit n=1 Tax=Cognatazoarcus halotolerans TaxID=2686016 RepID=UPI00190F7107|nr:HlyD family type I secretion periplasmic adaptor subunit [Cognatazoarcus halotolerans]
MSNAAEFATPALPTDPRGTILAGFAVILLFIAIFIGWASLAPLAEAVVASGSIKVDSSRKQIQHLDGGIVKEILVRDGDRVHQGDVLVRLDETRAAATVAILRDGYDAAIAQEARLLAERDQTETLVFPDALTGRGDEVKVSSIMKSQRTLWEARRSELHGEVQIIQKQVRQLRDDIAGYREQIAAKQRELSFVDDELKSMRLLREKGMVGKQHLLELEREIAKLEGERAELKSRISSAETEISRKELEIFQVGKTFHQGVVNELKQVQSTTLDLRERLNAAEHVFGQTEMRAPVDGIVVGSGVHTIGGVVSPGATLLEIVPANDKLIVEAKINPQDIDKVVAGLPAAIKLTAFNQRTTPELNGELRYVSADVLQDPQSKSFYYVARIEVPEEEVARLGDKQLQPGMVAEVFVRTGERTMAEYLLQPLRNSFRRAWLEE